MTEEGDGANVLSAGRKQSMKERFRDRLAKISDKADKQKSKQHERDEDLEDFLKSPGDEDALPIFPSPSRKPAPRISVSSSPRWPDAHDVTEKNERKPARITTKREQKKGLTVRFDQTPPQIIGEGGDECETPTIRVSHAKFSKSSHTEPNEKVAPIHSASVTSIESSKAEAHVGASDTNGDESRPRILIRKPTGLENEASGPGPAMRVEDVDDSDQAPTQSSSRLVPSLAVGLNRKMREEEARAFTSAVRKPPPEIFFQDQINAPTTQLSSEERAESPAASYARHGRSASSVSDLLSPTAQSPSPSRPSSSSSRESTILHASAAHLVGSEPRSNSSVRQQSTSPRRKPVPKPSAPQSRTDPLVEFRLHTRRYHALFALAAERREPGLDASLSRWIRAATWWFLSAETNFKLLRKELGEGATILQITTGRRHMQAMVDLAKTGWIVEDVVHDYANANSIDVSTVESIAHLIQAEPHSRRSRTLQYWQDLSSRFASLVAAVQRSGFMTSTAEDVPLSAGIDNSIWITYPATHAQVADWFRSANPPWARMDDSVTPAEPFDLAKFFPLRSTANTFRKRSMFCHISGRFKIEHQSPNMPCVLTIGRRRGSYGLVLFISSQDHTVNIVLETDPVRGDGIEWHKSNAGVLFNFADGFQFLVQLQKIDYLFFKECYDLALRVSIATVHDVLRAADRGETLIFRATAKTFEHRSKEKVASFPDEGEQRNCEIILWEKYEVVGRNASAQQSHRGFRLSVVLGPQAASLGILDIPLGGDSPILIHTAYEHSPPRVELLDSHHASVVVQFQQTGDFNRFYDLVTSLDHSAPEDVVVETMPLHSFSVEPSSPDAQLFLGAATWTHTEIKTAKLPSQLPGRVKAMTSSPTINICVCSDKVVVADLLSQGRYSVLMGLKIGDQTSVQLWRAAQQDMSMILRFREGGSSGPKMAKQLLAQSKMHSTRWKYTFATVSDLHRFQKSLTGAEVLFDGTPSSFLVSRGGGMRSKKEGFGAARVQILHDGSRQMWQLLAYFGDGQGMNFGLEASDVFERSNAKGKYNVRLVEAKVRLPAQEDEERRGFLCVEDVAEGDERDDITITFDFEDERDRLAQVLPASVRKASSLMGALHLR